MQHQSTHAQYSLHLTLKQTAFLIVEEDQSRDHNSNKKMLFNRVKEKLWPFLCSSFFS